MISLFVITYFAAVLFIGIIRRSPPDPDSYLFAGRKLTVPAFVATLVTTWYGGILEVGRFTFENGIVTWLLFGVFYYAAALLFVFTIAPRIQRQNIRTIPEFLHHHYGRTAALLGLVFVFLIVSPAPYVKILAVLFRHIWNIPELAALTIGMSLSVVYAVIGGFGAVVRTDRFQFILMFLGFSVILGTAVFQYGGWEFLSENAPEHAFAVPGKLSWTYILVWGFIALVTFIDPGFYQRCFAGNSQATVRKGILISILFWLIFDFLTVFTGIYASAILPADTASNAYLALADRILPPLSRALFITALFAIVMSTVDSFTFISAYTIGKDLPEILFGESYRLNSTLLTRWGLLITGAAAIVIARWFRHVVDIWYTVGSLAVPVLLVPLLAAMYRKPIRHPMMVMCSALTVSLAWTIYGMLNAVGGWPVYPFGVEPLYPGLTVSLILFILQQNR